MTRASEERALSLRGPTSPRRILVSNADTVVGRHLVHRLLRDDSLDSLRAVGRDAVPRSFHRLLDDRGGRLRYTRASLTRGGVPANRIDWQELREACDAVIHLPAPAGHDDRRSADEAAAILQHCLESDSIGHLVVLGSAYVYRLEEGNANLLDERSTLELDPRLAGELRAWVDGDLLLQSQLDVRNLCVTLLRTPTIVAPSGELILNPIVRGGGLAVRRLGFDPLCPLVAAQDAIHALILALRARRPGVFNIAGREAIPLSELARWHGASSVAIPDALLRLLSRASAPTARSTRLDRPDERLYRYGFSLDTRLARDVLGFEPSHRIAPSQRDGGRLGVEATAPI